MSKNNKRKAGEKVSGKGMKIQKNTLVLMLAALGCFLVTIILLIVSSAYVRTQKTQHSAKVWDNLGRYSMISIFTPEDNKLSLNDVRMLRYNIDNAFKADSIEAPSDNARLFVDSYNSMENISLSSERAGNQSLKAYVVGGDFFRFHEYKLISGSYINPDSADSQVVMLDKEAAWKLFGAIDVDGLTVEYNGTECTVIGVVEPQDGYLSQKSGAETGIAFVPSGLIYESGEEKFASCYEIILPNPVKDYASQLMEKAAAMITAGSEDTVLKDNSVRYDLLSSMKRIAGWKTKGMSFKAIKYPYWENSAIGVENIQDIFTFFAIVFATWAIIITVVLIVGWHPVRQVKKLVLTCFDRIQEAREKRREKNKKAEAV